MTTDTDTQAAKAALIRESASKIFDHYLGRQPSDETLNSFAKEGFSDRQIENFITRSKEYSQRGKISAMPNSGSHYDTAHLYLEPAKLIFCPIAKNANTSIKAWFLRLSGVNIAPDESVHFRASKSKLPFSYQSKYAIDQLMNDREVARVAVLRDPIERIVSAYWDKLVRTRKDPTTLKFHTGPIYKFVYQTEEVTPEIIEQGVSFRQYCHFLSVTNRNQTDPHWTAQHRYLESMQWTRFFDFRDIEGFEKYVLDRCPSELQDIRLKLQNVSPKTSKSSERFKDGDLANILPRVLSKLDGKPANFRFIDNDLKAFIDNYFAMDYRLLKIARS